MKILVAIDSSPSSQAVISAIAARRWPAGTTARVLNVVGSVSVYSGIPDNEPLFSAEQENAKALVMSAVDQLALRRIESSWVVTPGNPAAAILDYARAWRPDSVFIGSRGHSGLTRFFLGSVAKTVLRHAPCSVGVLRPVTGDRLARVGMKLLLATDGSKYSEAAVRSVAERPWPKGTKIKLVSVVVPPEIVKDPTYGMAGVSEEMHRAKGIEKERAQEALSTAGKILGSAGLKSAGIVPSGDAKAQIIDEARK
jgi:nucleotide-binding universal stress UspA family protein